MKTATSAMQSHLGQDCTTICRLYKITRTDDTVFAFTDHDKDIDTINYQSYLTDGGYVYEAAVGFSPTASENKSDLSVDNQEATCFIDSVQITEKDLRYGIWDSADVEVRVINWADLTQGEVRVRKGELGNLTMKNGVLTAELLGLTNKLQILLGRSFGTPCDAELGDSRCKAVVPVEQGTVNTNPSVGLNDAHHITPYSGLAGAGVLGYGVVVVSNPSGATGASGGSATCSNGATLEMINVTAFQLHSSYVFVLETGDMPIAGDSITIIGFANPNNNGTFAIENVIPIADGTGVGYYGNGILTFTSGNNSGLSFQIKSWDGITLTLDMPLFAPPADGDTFLISPGCGHNVFDCLNKFNNLDNHRGFPTIPGQDSILNYPSATG